MPARVLIIDGNTPEGTKKIVSLGGRPYGEGYTRALRTFDPGLEVTVIEGATGEALPAGVSLADYDGIAWTGSPLSAYEDQPEVERQIELAKAVHASRVPCFGSCWGQQIMCQALGGKVRANPNGIEIGVAREISLTASGAAHPMYAGKASPFDALAIHRDEVEILPPGGVVLARNGMSAIQAMELAGENGNFWGVQYHPEFDFALMALLYRRDEEVLVETGLCSSVNEVEAIAADFTRLDNEPGNSALARKHRLDADVLDPRLRMAEFANWLEAKVYPRASARS